MKSAMSKRRIAGVLVTASGIAFCFLWGVMGWVRYGSIAVGAVLIFLGAILLREGSSRA